jgi:Tol biopolymer transport system component/DNA-binding SARP family transcriptional activator
MAHAQVTLRMLGSIELSGPEGRPAAAVLAQPRRLALLIYLAAATPRGFHRKDTVRAVFWPDADSLRARQSLNRAIYFLRQALGAELLVTRGDDEVGLAEAHLRCDVLQLEQALDAGALEAGVELYRGDLAPGFLVSELPEFERWIEAERVRLRERVARAAMTLAERAEAGDRLELAEQWAQRAGALSPYDERLTAHRIALLDRMGNRSGALHAFEELRRRLREDLDVDPAPETVRLAEAVRARRDTRGPPGEAAAAAHPPPPAHGASADAAQPARAIRAAIPAVKPRPVRFQMFALLGAAAVGVAALRSVLLGRPRNLALTTTNAVAVTREPGIEFQPSLSPDGSLVAYTVVADRRTVVGLRSTAAGAEGVELRPAERYQEDQTLPTWSGDGQRLRYKSTPNPGVYPASFVRAANPGSFAWRDVDRLGGPVRTVELPREAAWVAWSRDGARAAYTVRDSIFTCTTAGSEPRLLAVHQGAWSLNSLAWSPDSRWIAYVSGNPFWPGGWNTAASQIWLVASATGERVPVTDAEHLNVSPAWVDAHHLLFVSDLEGQREIYVVAIGPTGAAGSPAIVPGGTDAHTISVSADGRRLAVARFVARQNVRRFPLGAQRPLLPHEGEPVTAGTQAVETHDVSPDGRWLAYDTDLHGDADIYKVRLDGGAPIPLVTGRTMVWYPRWSPDGTEIAYSGGDSTDIWVVSADGGQPTRLTDTPEIDETPIWSPDGLSLAFRSLQQGHLEAWSVSRDRVGGRWGKASRLTDLACAFQAWARDGSGLICGAQHQTALTLISRSGRVRWRRDLAASGLSLPGPPAISPDGATLYLRAARGTEAGIWAWPVSGGPARLVVSFDERSPTVLAYPGTINVTRDGLYLTVGEYESDIWVMDLVRR